MYSTIPLADPNLTHFGFYFSLAMMSFFSTMAVSILCAGLPIKEIIRASKVAAVIVTIIMVYPFYASFIKELPIPENTPVTATRVGLGEKMSSGKYPTMNAQIMYQTPDGVVSFGMGSGQPWPDTVVLYKNQ
jgi:hypothetical protein